MNFERPIEQSTRSESEPLLNHIFYTHAEGSKDVKRLCAIEATTSESAYEIYVTDCEKKGEEPLPRAEITVSSL